MKPADVIVLLTALLCAGCASLGTMPSPPSASTAHAVMNTANDTGPSLTAAQIAEQAAPSVESHVRLGVHCEKVTPQLARTAHLSVDTGVRVVTVEAGSVAQQNGIKVGDIIVKYGDRPISEVNDLAAAIAATNWGAVVPITIARRAGAEDVLVQF